MLHVSYKPAATDWLGSFGLPNAGEDMSWYRFVQRTNERQLTVLGFPPPGHPYWTAADPGRGGGPLPDARPLALAGRGGGRRPAARRRDAAGRPRGGGRVSCTRSIRGRSPTATRTAWATCPASSSISTTWSGSASTASGSHPSPSHPMPTGATTSRTSAPSRPEFGTLNDFDRLIAEGGSTGASVSSWTSCRTTRAISTRGSSTRGRRAPRPDRDWYLWADGRDGGSLPTTGSAASAGPGGRSTR